MRPIAIAVALGLIAGAVTGTMSQSSESGARPSLDRPRTQAALINNAPDEAELETVWTSNDRLVTGVAVSEQGRVFLNFPLWYPERYDGAVAELRRDGSLEAYPNEPWNAWRPDDPREAHQHFVCVQSVVADGEGSLWALDAGAPWPTGLIDNAPKLVKINLERNEVERIYGFDREVAPEGSYLNDVRIDTQRDYAYITDSGGGGIITVNLRTADAWRSLDEHPAVRAEDVPLRVGGREVQDQQGKTPQIHADGIAYDPAEDVVYFHALTGYHTYRVPARVLRERTENAADYVKNEGSDVVTDGMRLDADGNLYYTALEYNGILKRTPEGDLVPVVIAEELRWPDTLAIAPDGHLYITTSQIHNTPRFAGEWQLPAPFGVHRIDLGLEPPRARPGAEDDS